MKKVLLLCLCFLFIFQASALDIGIDENYNVVVDREAILSALMDADIVSMRKAIDLGLISCEELTSYYLERIEAYNETYQCFITLCDDALQIAQQRDASIADGTAKGSLFGIPIVVKDNLDYEGYVTSNGLYAGNKRKAEKSAAVVQYLVDEGAVILGKTNMSAAAQDALCSINASGLQTYNAYNPILASGGSSGGSAVAVSLNFAAAALGTDTNASLRYPSALNGCVTIRPTFDLISREGCTILNYSRDTVGAITRNVADQAIMLDVMTCGTNRYYENLNQNALQGMRIGVLTELSYPIEKSYNREDSDLDDEIQTAFDNAVEELKLCGAEVIPVSMPTIFSYISSNSTSTRLYGLLDEILQENSLSAIIYPTYLHTPHYTTNEYLKGKSIYDLPYICNCATLSPLTGAPEMTVQIGNHSLGAGIGMEIISLKNNEQVLLDITYSYTSQFDHRQIPASAPALHFGEQEVTLKQFLALYEQAKAQAASLQDTAEKSKEQFPSAPLPSIITDVASDDHAENPFDYTSLLWILLLPISGCAATVWFIVRRKKQITTSDV